MLELEITLKTEGRKVSAEDFVRRLASEFSKEIRRQIEITTVRPAQPTVGHFRELSVDAGSALSRPRAVGIIEAARMVNLSAATIRRYVSQGRIPCARVGRRILIKVKTIDTILNEGLQSSII